MYYVKNDFDSMIGIAETIEEAQVMIKKDAKDNYFEQDSYRIEMVTFLIRLDLTENENEDFVTVFASNDLDEICDIYDKLSKNTSLKYIIEQV